MNGDVGVVTDDLHTQFFCCVGNLYAYGAQADNTQSLSVDFGTYELALTLFGSFRDAQFTAGFSQVRGPCQSGRNVSRSNQQSAQNQFLYGIGIGAGGVEDNDPFFRTTVDGDVVDACACAGDCHQLVRELHAVHVSAAD